jgi:predicted dehydrogenase
VTSPVSLGLMGLGRSGTSLVRALATLEDANVTWLWELDPAKLELGRRLFPAAQSTESWTTLLEDEKLEAIVIAAPSDMHARLALEALRRDKHVLIDNPSALRGEDADRLTFEAAARGRCLLVGHVLLHHPAIRKLKELIETGELGEIIYVHASRLGPEGRGLDENVLSSSGAQHVAALLYLLDEYPSEVSSRGDSSRQDGERDVVFCHLKFPSGITAHLHLSWLDAHNVRRLTVVGTKRMAVVDETATERKLTIYESAPLRTSPSGYVEGTDAGQGEILCPKLPHDEPLSLECAHFLEAIRSMSPAQSSSRYGAAVVHVLEALQRSLKSTSAARTREVSTGTEPGSAFWLAGSH